MAVEGDMGDGLLTLTLSMTTHCSPGLLTRNKRKRSRGHHHETKDQKNKCHSPVPLDDFLHMRHEMDENAPGRPHLIRLLLLAAGATDGRNADAALRELYAHTSLHGPDAIQRVAAHFADALASRLLTRTGSAPPAATSTLEEAFAAFTEFYVASPYYQFAHFTANQAILEAFEAAAVRRLHVIDFDVDASYGFQWPSLIQSLSDKATPEDPIWLRITGVGGDAAELRATGERLKGFAGAGCCPSLEFQFEGLPRWSEEGIETAEDGTTAVAVNMVMCHTNIATTPTELHRTLAGVRRMNPSVVTVVEREGSMTSSATTTPGFMQRFVEELQHYGAMFESLHNIFPAESGKRLRIERHHLGREIKSSIGDAGDRRYCMGSAMEGAGFEGVRMSTVAVSQAKLLLKIKGQCCSSMADVGGGFGVEDQRGDGISLMWRGRDLITASAWRPCAEQRRAGTTVAAAAARSGCN